MSLSQLAGVPVECPRDWAAASIAVTGSADHTGYFEYDRRVMGLRPDICIQLNRLVDGYKPSVGARLAYGLAVFVFAHELQHVDGVTDETRADCGAAQTFDAVAEDFGLTLGASRQLAQASRSIDGYDATTIADCWPRGSPPRLLSA